jgi:ATP-dependent DNA helicase PIF1
MVKTYNTQKINLLKQNNKTYVFKSTFDYQNIKDEFKQQYEDMINKVVDINDEIELTIDTQVMLTVNGLDDNLANGSVGKIIKFEDEYPIVQFSNGIVKKIIEFSWSLNDTKDKKEPNITKKQLPLILAWAITIHRAQGATLDYVYTDIGNSIFEFGQAYVTLSRVKTLDGLFIKNIKFKRIKANPKVIDFYKKIN